MAQIKIKLNQNGIKEEDLEEAIRVRNHILRGQFVIGNPALGLKKTLVDIEHKLKEKQEYNPLKWQVNDNELIQNKIMLEAGIKGEEQLAEYLSNLIKYDDSLAGLIAFASLSYEQENNNLDYIPDTDMLLVYGRNIMIVDAKNLKTSAYRQYRLEDNKIIDDKDKELLEVHPSVYLWQEIFNKAGIEIDSYCGYVCIVNNTETNIERNYDWYDSYTRPIHISELLDELHEWIKDKDNTVHLDILTEIAKAEIKEEKEDDALETTLENMKNKFNL